METETKPLWTTTREAMGKTFAIELWPSDAGLSGSSDLGHSWSSQQWIRINAHSPAERRDQTILHEIVHTVNHELKTDLEEKDVCRLAAGVYAFLRGFGLWNEFPWPDVDKPHKR